jgi:hypothetical protein
MIVLAPRYLMFLHFHFVLRFHLNHFDPRFQNFLYYLRNLYYPKNQ